MTYSELKETIRQTLIKYKSTEEYLKLSNKEAISNMNRILCENIGMYLGYYFDGDTPIVLYRQLECIYRLIVAHSLFLVREDIISDKSKHAIEFVKGEVGWLQDFFVLYHLADEIYDLLPDCEINDEFISYITTAFACLKDDILQD